MFARLIQLLRERRAPGQSLVETALFMPILLIMLAGVVEVSNLLVTQNRVSSAARVATGFGATNIVDKEWETEEWEKAMAQMALNHVTDTLDLSADVWDIWAIKAKLDESGNIEKWDDRHGYGNYQVVSDAEWNAMNATVQADVLAALNEPGSTVTTTMDTADLEFVATVDFHDRESLLGLDVIGIDALTRIRGLNVMRVTPKPGIGQCNPFPIAIYLDNLSLYPENYAEPMVPGGQMYDPLFWDPANPGPYNDSPYDHSAFPNAKGGHRLTTQTNAGVTPMQQGDVFIAREDDFNSGGFGWLTWNGETNTGALVNSMTYPGNLTLYKDANGDPVPADKVNYANPYDPADYIPNIGDWVQGSTGNMAANDVRAIMDGLITSGRPIMIIAFQGWTGSGANHNYKIAAFMVVKLRGYRVTASNKQILVEFIKWGNECTVEE